MPHIPNLVVRYQLRSSTAMPSRATGADRWCDAVALKVACAAQHDAHQSTADAREAAVSILTRRWCNGRSPGCAA